jgi:site-specific recombinase XerD
MESMPIFNVDVTADPHCPRVVGSDHAPAPSINDFLSYLEQCARSPYTVRAYARGLAHFAGWLHEAAYAEGAVYSRWRIGASPTSAERTASTPTSVSSSSG